MFSSSPNSLSFLFRELVNSSRSDARLITMGVNVMPRRRWQRKAPTCYSGISKSAVTPAVLYHPKGTQAGNHEHDNQLGHTEWKKQPGLQF